MYDISKDAQRQNMAAQLGNMVPAFKMLTAIGSWLASVIAFPWEAIMRHDFGERYFSFTNALFSIVFVAVPFGTLFSGGAQLIGYYVTAAMIAAAYHLFVIWRRKKSGDMWYSYYDGTPWLLHVVNGIYPMDESTVQRFVEPAVGLVLVLIVLPFFGMGAGTYYIAASIFAAILGTNLRLQEQRHQWLDMIDGQLMSRYMAAAATGEPPSKTQGVTIASENVTLIKELSKDQQMRRAIPLQLRAAVSDLSEDEQAMLDAEAAGEPRPATSPAANRQSASAVDPFSMLDDEEPVSRDGHAEDSTKRDSRPPASV
jgi:hypothetical protein